MKFNPVKVLDLQRSKVFVAFMTLLLKDCELFGQTISFRVISGDNLDGSEFDTGPGSLWSVSRFGGSAHDSAKSSHQSLHEKRFAVKIEDNQGISSADWDRIAAAQEFKDLMAAKKLFIIPAFVFFVAYYFLLPILVGYAPRFMATKVIGVVNIAYLFALSQFVMAWGIAALYVKAASAFDRLAKDIIENHAAGAAEGK